jgi:SRSO17 transposase
MLCMVTVLDDLDADLALVEGWEWELGRVGDLIGARFSRYEPRQHAVSYVKGLLSDVPTRNGWTIAEASGHKTPDKIQKMLNQAAWDEAGVREDVRAYITANLGDRDAVLVFDETGDIKQGRESVATARQYTGVTGQVENYQIAVFAGYHSKRGQALVDAELYVPKEWVGDPERAMRAGIPPERRATVSTKGQLAVVMLQRALAGGMPFSYVAGDEVYGRSPDLRQAIEAAERGYVLEVGCDFRLEPHRADEHRDMVPRRGWQLRSQGAGAKGMRYHQWAWVALDSRDCPDGWRRSLLIRRGRDSEDEYAYFLCYHRRGASLAELVDVAGRRWSVEECFAVIKSEAGYDQHQVRRWIAWQRHTVLALLAQALLAVIRAHIPANPGAWQTD